MSSGEHKTLWRSDITGLRALAVIPVVLYHAYASLVPGGFVGVDVFFVISGYLISGIIFRNLQKKNTVGYLDFYQKRIRRIFPNLILLLVFVMTMGYFYMWDEELRELGKHVYSSAAFYQNFRLMAGLDYFGPDARTMPLLHLWSLSIEEQFYLLFPVLCGVVWRIRRSEKALGVLVVFITAASLLLCLSIKDQQVNFYLPFSRFWELGAGILLSYAEHFRYASPRSWSLNFRHGLSIVGLMMLAAAMFGFDHDSVFPGVSTLLPVLGAVFLIAAHEDACVNRVLSSRPLVFIGLISYSLYLWHWPFLAFQRILVPTWDWVIPVALGLSVLVSVAVYYWVENPCRRLGGKDAVVFLVGLVLCFGLGEYVKLRAHAGWGSRLEGQLSSLVEEKLKELRSAQIHFDVINGVSIYQNTAGTVDVLFVGDSHMGQYAPRIKKRAEETGVKTRILSRGACMAIPLDGRPKCDSYYKAVADALNNDRPKRVVFAQIWGSYARLGGVYAIDGDRRIELKDGGFDILLDQFVALTERYPETEFFFVLDAPWDDLSYAFKNRLNRLTTKPEDFERELVRLGRVSFPEDDSWLKGNNAVEAKMRGHAHILTPLPWVCPGDQCNLLAYMDDDHLAPSYTRDHAVWIDEVFEGLPASK